MESTGGGTGIAGAALAGRGEAGGVGGGRGRDGRRWRPRL